jgi:hypothetical protein
VEVLQFKTAVLTLTLTLTLTLDVDVLHFKTAVLTFLTVGAKGSDNKKYYSLLKKFNLPTQLT